MSPPQAPDGISSGRASRMISTGPAVAAQAIAVHSSRSRPRAANL